MKIHAIAQSAIQEVILEPRAIAVIVETLDQSISYQVSAIPPAIVTPTTYTQSFVNEEITNSKIVITHGLKTLYPNVVLFNNEDVQVFASDVWAIDPNNAEVDLGGYTPITGVWRVSISIG